MAEPSGSANPIKKGDDSNGDQGNDPKKPDKSPAPLDITKLGDEDVFKVLEDPRIWNTPRLKELTDASKRLKKLEEAQKTAEEAKLKEQGKLTELNERLTKERDEAIAKANNTLMEMKIASEATKLGAVDTEAILKLIDRSSIKVDENGLTTGVEEAVKALQTGKTYLFGKPGQPNIGNPTNPGTDTNQQVRRFKHSEIKDPEFYKANQAEVDKAFRLGLIEDDLAQ